MIVQDDCGEIRSMARVRVSSTAASGAPFATSSSMARSVSVTSEEVASSSDSPVFGLLNAAARRPSPAPAAAAIRRTAVNSNGLKSPPVGGPGSRATTSQLCIRAAAGRQCRRRISSISCVPARRPQVPPACPRCGPPQYVIRIAPRRLLRRRPIPGLAVQFPDQLREQFRQLARHEREVEIELLGRIDLLLILALGGDLEELDAFDLQLFRQNEGDPAVPGQPELSGTLTARDIGADLLAVERMP